jgi:hypothetical protein
MVVEHWIQTRELLSIHNDVNAEVNDLTAKVNTATVDTLDSKSGRKSTNIMKL